MRIFKTIILVGVMTVALLFTETATEIANKYQSMNQFNNSEFDYQLLKRVEYINYLNYFTIGLGAFAMFSIWKPKKVKQSNTENNESN